MVTNDTARYLIWSNTFGAWRGPNITGSRTKLLQEAGRYTLHEATTVVADLTQTPEGPMVFPDEVIMLAPESMRELLALAANNRVWIARQPVGEDLDDETALNAALTPVT